MRYDDTISIARPPRRRKEEGKIMELIWDFDGTLFNSYPAMVSSWQEAMREEGHDVPIEDIHARMKTTLRDAIDYYKASLGVSDAAEQRYKAILREKGLECIRPFDGVREICAQVVANGGHNHLCTHRGMEAKAFMEHWGIAQYFTHYVTADDGLPRKPAPDMVRKVLALTGKPKEEHLMLGDRELDILSAHGAGIKACLYTEGKHNVHTEAEYIVEEYADFWSKIKGE